MNPDMLIPHGTMFSIPACRLGCHLLAITTEKDDEGVVVWANVAANISSMDKYIEIDKNRAMLRRARTLGGRRCSGVGGGPAANAVLRRRSSTPHAAGVLLEPSSVYKIVTYPMRTEIVCRKTGEPKTGKATSAGKEETETRCVA